MSPEGDHIWLKTENNVPVLNTREAVVNKVNELEAYALIDAKSQSGDRAPRGVSDEPLTVASTSRPLTQEDLGTPFFLELFAGSERLSKAVETKAQGKVKVIRIDIRNNVDDDLLKTDCWLRVQELVNSGNCIGIWMAPPCSSWSTARRRDEHHAPPLGDAQHLFGFDTLPARDLLKVRQANELMERCYQLAITATLNRVPWAIENPYHSLCWKLPNFQYLARRPGVSTTRYDFCMFGEEYHKSTRILSCGYNSMAQRAKTCPNQRGLCQRTGKPHTPLSGTVDCPEDKLHLLDPPGKPLSSGRAEMETGSSRASVLRPNPLAKAAPQAPRKIWRTKLAEPYPLEVCDAWAEMILEHPNLEHVGSDKM